MNERTSVQPEHGAMHLVVSLASGIGAFFIMQLVLTLVRLLFIWVFPPIAVLLGGLSTFLLIAAGVLAYRVVKAVNSDRNTKRRTWIRVALIAVGLAAMIAATFLVNMAKS